MAAQVKHCEGCSGSVPEYATMSNAYECRGIPTDEARGAEPRTEAMERLRTALFVYDAMPIHEVTEDTIRGAEGRIIEAAREAAAAPTLDVLKRVLYEEFRTPFWAHDESSARSLADNVAPRLHARLSEKA